MLRIFLGINLTLIVVLFGRMGFGASSDTYLTFDIKSQKLSQLLIKYRVTDDWIQLGGVYLKDSNFGMKLESDQSLVVFWPSEVFREGVLELIRGSGEVFYQKNISEADLEVYSINSFEEAKNQYHDVKVVLPFRESWQKDIKTSGSVFACLRNKKQGDEILELCTSPFRLVKNSLVLRTKNSATKVMINDRADVSNDGELLVDTANKAGKTHWFAQLHTGLSWRFNEVPPVWKIIELLKVEDQLFKISGIGPRPLKFFSDHFTRAKRDFLFEKKPSPLFEENPFYWTLNIQSQKDIELNFINPNGGIYTQRFDILNVPHILQSPLVKNNNNPHLTYSPDITYRVETSSNTSLVDTPEVTTLKKGQSYLWRAKDLKKGSLAERHLRVKFDDGNSSRPADEKKFFLQVYRGFSTDVGVQFTVSTVAGGVASGSEFHGSYWSEDLYGLGYADWLRLRLGLGFKYFQPQKKIPVAVDESGSQKKEVEISSSVLDLKYRFQPGLWGRDESFGAMLTNHQFTFDEYKLNLLGLGVFWARSMPVFFDELFNVIPFFRYPKWVSAEWVSFFKNSDSNLRMKSCYHLNFYGKVMWTPVIYGDLGFGIRTYDFEDLKESRNPKMSLYFLTLGMGYIF